MAWLLTICEGRPFDIMVRAAELALALADKIEAQVVFEKAEAYSPWRHLLSSPQQVRLRALALDPKDDRRHVLQSFVDQTDLLRGDRNASMETWRQAMATLKVNYVQVLTCRTGEGVPPRPPPSTWLLLLGDSDLADPATLARYERIFSFGPLPGDHPVLHLPPAISTEHFAPPAEGDPIAPRDAVLLIGNGDLRTDCRLAEWLSQSGARVTLFDPYHSRADYQGSLPRNVAYADPRPPEARRACYVQHAAVLVAKDACHADNHFLWEAVHCGLMPLQAHTPDAAGWSPALLSTAMRAHLANAAVAAAPVKPQSWQRLVTHFESHANAPPPVANTLAPTYAMSPHRVVMFRDLEQAVAGRGRTAQGARSVAILLPSEGATWDPTMAAALQPYQQLLVDTTDNAEFLVGLLSAMYSVPTDTTDNLHSLLQTLLSSPTPQSIDIIHLDDTHGRIYSTKRVLDGLFESWRSAGSAQSTPQLLVHMAKPYESGNVSKQRIGVSVATEAIAGGLLADAEGRFKLLWLGKQGFAVERGRTYFYSFPPNVGVDLDEVDYPALPTLLANNRVDVLCCVDPFLAAGLSARTQWAQKAVPLVGMLHSVHAASGATEVVMQLLSGPTLPCDAIISPSRCGAQAYQGLYDAAAEWIAHFAPSKPRYAGRMEVIPYGIETSHYQGLHRGSCREALGLPVDGILLLSFGRFSRQEKCDVLPLLLALHALRREHPRLQLLLAGGRGNENYADAVRSMVRELKLQDAVHVYDDVDGRDKILMYGAADVFVSISDNIQETYGLTLLEAMAASLPVVASAWNGYREIVRHDETGFLVPTSMAPMPSDTEYVQRITEGLHGYGHRDLHESVVVDPFALAHAISTLAQNAELRARMGQAALRICRADYDLLKQGRKTGDCLLELLRMAKQTPWPMDTPLRPFRDPVGQRFAHYPSDGFVQDDTRVTLSPWGAADGWSNTVRGLLEINSRHENTLLSDMFDTVAKHAPISIGDLATRLQNPHFTAAQIKPRVVRCLKYGFFQRVDA